MANVTVDLSRFETELKDSAARVSSLLTESAGLNSSEPLVEVALHQLQEQLEELSVAHEELRAQNESLATFANNLLAERSRYLELFDEVPEVYVITDQAGKVLQANRAACDILNFSRDMLQKKVLSALVPLEDRKAFRKYIRALKTTSGRVAGEVVFRPRGCEGGLKFHASATMLQPLFHDEQIQIRWLFRPADDADAVALTDADVTVGLDKQVSPAAHLRTYISSQALLQKQTEQMRVAEELSKMVSQQIGSHCFVSLLSSDRKSLLPVAASATGKKSDRVEKSFRMARSQPVDDNIAQQVLEAGEPCVIMTSRPAQSKIGDYRSRMGSVNMLLMPLRANDTTVGLLTAIRDPENRPYNPTEVLMVQNLANAAAGILLNERLRLQVEESGNERNSQKLFMNSLCRDLQEPLHAICGYAGMLEEQCAEYDVPEIGTDARAVYKAAQRAVDLLSDLHAVSRIEGGNLKIEKQRIPALELVADLELEIQKTFQLPNFQISAPDDLHLISLRTDPVWARQAIIYVIKAASSRFVEDVTCRVEDTALVFEMLLSNHEGFRAAAAGDLPETLKAHTAGLRERLAARLCSALNATFRVEQADGRDRMVIEFEL